ncbi:hypothetical protein QNO21_09600 [Microbacterium sp. zg-Y818]|uniref:hypothetical protein n=1 Tax=unclassified Microbacterium TaxID=2609290 RepID=UPI00214CF3ED|nr:MULTISPECIES: hypothetical protein [unclassified Microbacterium]MCR2799378.1 hypothetical protein [Microbacterium sp. zg.Y818]WIM21377.1 hypothetical protein QNO21_09600 [Microbacterium sp. zg-Y818]
MAARLSLEEEHFLTYGAGGEQPDMTPFACPSCDNRVLVRKNGPAQTSVQWTEHLRCPVLRAASSAAERALVDSCPTLNNAIDDAVLVGDIRLSAQLDGHQEQRQTQ